MDQSPPDKLRFSVAEAAAAIGVSKSFLHARIAAGALEVQNDARRTFIRRDELVRYVSSCPAGCAPKRGQRKAVTQHEPAA